MHYRLEHSPVFSVLTVELDAGESAIAQPGSMLSMTSGIQVRAKMGRQGSRRGWWSGFKNVLGGESFFTSEYFAKSDAQTLVLAPDSLGDILPLPLDQRSYYLTRGSYLANLGPCELQPKYGGMKGVMSKKGLFLLHAAGTGVVFCQTFGAVVERELAAEENLYVDNRFVIAFSDTVRYQLVKASGSVKDSLMSGEGLINRYTGPGRVYYQTRGKPGFGLLGHLVDAIT